MAISFEMELQTALKNALKRHIFQLASAHFKSKRIYVDAGHSSCEGEIQ